MALLSESADPEWEAALRVVDRAFSEVLQHAAKHAGMYKSRSEARDLESGTKDETEEDEAPVTAEFVPQGLVVLMPNGERSCKENSPDSPEFNFVDEIAVVLRSSNVLRQGVEMRYNVFGNGCLVYACYLDKSGMDYEYNVPGSDLIVRPIYGPVLFYSIDQENIKTVKRLIDRKAIAHAGSGFITRILHAAGMTLENWASTNPIWLK